MKKILLHICCAPCALYVYEKLRKEYEVTGFFYNPNIHPKKEYDFRKDELIKVAKIYNWDIVYAEYDMGNWFKEIKGYEKEPEKGKRCSICFNIRLKKTFEYAKEENFDIVTSTLSISPHKNTEQINIEGYKLSKDYNINFLDESFKKKNGYHIGRKMGKEIGVKAQDYCGCTYSKVERILFKRERNNSIIDLSKAK
jgi:predicted adenine nucleotide alpha hydrolase (AANH) superfamily ATPase